MMYEYFISDVFVSYFKIDLGFYNIILNLNLNTKVENVLVC